MSQNILRQAENFQNILSGTGASGLPTPDRALFALWQIQVNTGALGADPFQIVNDQVTGGVLNNGSGAEYYIAPTIDNGPVVVVCIWAANFGILIGSQFVSPTRKVKFKTKLSFLAIDAVDFLASNYTYFVGLSDKITNNVPAQNGNCIGFGFTKVGTFALGNWVAYCSNAGVVSAVDTGVPVKLVIDGSGSDIATWTPQKLEFNVGSNNEVTFVIDGLPAASISTNLPTVPLAMTQAVISGPTQNGGGGSLRCAYEYFYVENSTP